MIPNPWLIIGALLSIAGALGGGYYWGSVNTRNAVEAAAAREDRVAQIAYEAAQRGAAEEIAKLTVKHVTLRQTLEKEIVHVKSYADCRHTPDAFRVLNNALSGKAAGVEPAGSSELPSVDGPR